MVVSSQTDVVAVLTRAPSAGGKTRLFASLGCAPDPDLLTALLLDTLDAAAPPGVRRVVAVEPPTACDDVGVLVPHDVRVIPQSGGSLGDRMRAVFERLLGGGAARVALVGSDLPTLTPRAVGGAFARLRADPGSIVIGPAHDGGYYLIAADAVPPVFDTIEWGSSRVLTQTLDAAARNGVCVHLAEAISDIDTREDLMRLVATHGRDRAPRTIAWALARGIGGTKDVWT
jgi:rSAM/selenodomain-associated transferase 1